MYYEEHFFWRYQEQLKAEEAEFEAEFETEAYDEDENDYLLNAVGQICKRVYLRNRNQEKIRKYYQLAAVAYDLAQSQHYNITVADGRDTKGEIRFMTDGLVFSAARLPKDKSAFAKLLSEADLFFLEPDDEYVQMTFYFDLCGPEGRIPFSMDGIVPPSPQK